MNIIFSFLLSFITTTIAIPPTIWLAKRFNLLDNPKLRPHPAHVQNRIIPRAGGIAIFLGIMATAMLFVPMQKYLIGIILGLIVLLAIGVADDKLKSVNPYLRLGLLALAALLPVASGISISFITNPLQSGEILKFDKPIADFLAILWIVALTQIINWSKGVDGQMPGITMVAAGVLGALSIKFYLMGDMSQIDIAKLAFATSGASLGFLIFNWHPAKILPGFSGSTILAFMLATLAILSGAKVAISLLVLGIPTADFIYTFFRRIFEGHSPVWGDRGHLHHKLLNLGWSHQRISLFYMTVSAMLGAAALTFDTNSKIFALCLVAVGFVIFVLWINSFGGVLRHPGPDNG